MEKLDKALKAAKDKLKKLRVVHYPDRLKRIADVSIISKIFYKNEKGETKARENALDYVKNTSWFATDKAMKGMITKAKLPEGSHILKRLSGGITVVMLILPDGVGFCGLAIKNPNERTGSSPDIDRIALGRALASYKAFEVLQTKSSAPIYHVHYGKPMADALMEGVIGRMQHRVYPPISTPANLHRCSLAGAFSCPNCSYKNHCLSVDKVKTQ